MLCHSLFWRLSSKARRIFGAWYPINERGNLYRLGEDRLRKWCPLPSPKSAKLEKDLPLRLRRVFPSIGVMDKILKRPCHNDTQGILEILSIPDKNEGVSQSSLPHLGAD